jgi:hypothetical protein
MHAVLLSLALIFQQTAPATEAPVFVQRMTAEDGTITVQTGVHHLTAEGKPDVWLVGAVHVAEARYYQEIQEILDAREVVLYEGVKPSKDAPKLTPEEVKAQQEKEKGLYTTFSEVLGLDFQQAHINYTNPAWINSDLTWEEMDALNKKLPEGSSQTFGMIQQLMDPKSPTANMATTFLRSPTPGLKEALKVFFVKMLGDPKAAAAVSNDPGFTDIILGARNKSAEDHFAELLTRPTPPKSVAIFYGAAHHPGIEATLVSTYGYKVAESKWLSAASANPNTLSDEGKKMLKMFEGMGAGGQKGGGEPLQMAAALN